MSQWTEFSYRYDGSYAGFLTCVFESYARRELPEQFSTAEDPRVSLWPERAVETDREKAGAGLPLPEPAHLPAGPGAGDPGLPHCMPDKELRLYEFLRLGYRVGPAVVRDLADPRTAAVWKAVRHLANEAHLLKGFLRFSDQGGVLVGEIAPKNRVLPLLRPHFCARYSGETFVIYDPDPPGGPLLPPPAVGHPPPGGLPGRRPGPGGAGLPRLWRRFYDTVAIQGRENPRCRMTQMPKRYWSTMTEFQEEPEEGEKFLPERK